MDVAYVSALSAHVGSVVGGLTLGSLWPRCKPINTPTNYCGREELFKDFIIAAAKAARRARQPLAPSKRQRLLFPGTSDEHRHLHCSIICPQDAQHLSPVIHVEPVRQVRLRVLSLDRVSIAW